MRFKSLLALFIMSLIAVGCSSDTTDAGDTSTGESQQVEAGESSDASNNNNNASNNASDDSDAEADTGDGDGASEPEQDDAAAESDDPVAIAPGTEVRLVTHDSFSISDGLFDEFTLETGIDVEVIKGGDAGEVVARAILSADQPEGDVMFGIDNTFLQRGLDADLFLAYESPGLAAVPDELELDDQYRVTPIDFGDVCVNYWLDGVDQAPAGIEALADPAYASGFVTQNPETSSPGFAFLLATIAHFGEDGWEDYWQRLRDGGVTVTSGWSDAYYGEFIAGGGEKPIVTSYASSPVAEVLFAAEPIDSPPTRVITDTCFRQIEFAGILAGTEVEAAAQQVIDFMLSETFQADIPLNMFVAPANAEVPLPDLYQAHAAIVDSPLTLTPAEIEANRSQWTERWAEIVLR
jgi:thiamine transport system substrate-binding protein